MKPKLICTIVLLVSVTISFSQTVAELQAAWARDQKLVDDEYAACRESCPKDKVGRAHEWDCDGMGGGPQLPSEICGCKCEASKKNQSEVLREKYTRLIKTAERTPPPTYENPNGNPNLEMRPTYEKAAQAFLEAASKTKCPQRREFFIRGASFNQCMANVLGGVGSGDCGNSPDLSMIPPCPEDENTVTSSPVTLESTESNNKDPKNVSQLIEIIGNPELRKEQLVGGSDGFITYGQTEALGNALSDLSANIARNRQSKKDAERDYEHEKQYGFTISQYKNAIESNDTSMVTKMLKRGMDIKTNVTGYDYSLNGFHLAAMNGSIIMCRYFLNRGMDVNVLTNNKHFPMQVWTPLFFAIDNDRSDCVKFLLSKGANPYHKVSHIKGYSKLNARELAKRYNRHYIEKILKDWEKTHPEN